MKIPEHHFEDGIPVFKPNAEEFSNFATLISSIQSVASCVGLAKIIPPFEISVRVPNNIAISNPIQQCIYKGLLPNGAYQTLNMQSNKSYSLDDWISLDSIPAYHTPDYSSDHCDFLEKHYWKHLTYGNILYGADIKGSLFENAKSTSPWNLNRIDNLLNNLQHSLPGVNIPYLYFGLFKSTFAWHVEDMDLYSINFIHSGAPKQWYVIPPEFALKFERFASSLFSSDANTCSQFLRHKANIISPNLLLKNDIKVHKIIHRQGEIMITYPKSYHQGFNLGFNCAESVNFATRDWIPHGLTAKYCSCIPDSVRLDVKGLFSDIDTLILHTRDFASNVNNELILYGGRKQAIVQKSVKSKSKPVVLKITIPKGPHCALCTDFNDVTLIKTDSLNKFVHLHCAQGIPECTVKDSICINFNLIPKSRFSLKCDYCKTKHGACIQCFKGKCKRSYHVSCALIHLNYKYNSELDMGESYCSQHDSANILERKRKLEIINNEIALIDFQVGKLVIVKAKSFSYQGIVEELNAELQNCIVGFNGASFTIDWKNLSKFSAPERIEQVETVYKQNKVIKRVKKVSEEDDGEMEKDGCDAVDGLIVCPKVV